MRTILVTLLSIAFVFNGLAQIAVLPATEDFATTPILGTGWTTNTFNHYSSGITGNAAKLQATGHFVQVDFAEEPGDLTYNLRGYTAGTPWVGTFSVEESDDGTIWSTMAQHIDNLDNQSYLNFTVTPQSTSRYIRFYYTDKISGANVGLDDVTLALPAATASQEINLTTGGNSTLTGSTVYVGSAISMTEGVEFDIENLGTADTLTVDFTSSGFSGPDAAQFSIAIPGSTVSIPPSSDETFFIEFTPTSAGTKSATFSLVNNDADEDPYTIELIGYGDNIATQPSTQPASLTFSNITSYGMEGTFSPAAGAESYIVLRKVGAPVTEIPVDGTRYNKGEGIGDAKVFYSGPDNTFPVNEVRAGLDYYYAVFSYNGVDDFANYLESSPLTEDETSLASMAGNYYSAIDDTASTFVSDLQALINPHTQNFYGNYRTSYLGPYLERDTTGIDKVLNCQYSNEYVSYTPPFDFTPTNTSREHVFPSSWMPTFGTPGHTDEVHYSDYYNLFLVNFLDVNTTRSNLPLGNVVNVSSTYLEAAQGTDSSGTSVYEPRDEIKGDAARSIFYMMTCYNGSDGNNWELRIDQDQNVLKQWNLEDPVDAFEMGRNDFISSLQGNRNPFIDHPEWACRINFRTMNYIANVPMDCSTPADTTSPPDTTNVGIDDPFASGSLGLFPNPADDQVTISIHSGFQGETDLTIHSITGKLVQSSKLVMNGTNQLHRIDVSSLESGTYIMSISGSGVRGTRRVSVIR